MCVCALLSRGARHASTQEEDEPVWALAMVITDSNTYHVQSNITYDIHYQLAMTNSSCSGPH